MPTDDQSVSPLCRDCYDIGNIIDIIYFRYTNFTWILLACTRIILLSSSTPHEYGSSSPSDISDGITAKKRKLLQMRR
jgi:hypothetical protein